MFDWFDCYQVEYYSPFNWYLLFTNFIDTVKGAFSKEGGLVQSLAFSSKGNIKKEIAFLLLFVSSKRK